MENFERSLKAAIEGKFQEMERLVAEDKSDVLLCGTTEEGNTCLHIASLCDHRDFCSKVLMQNSASSLLSITNKDGETPLLIAVRSGRVPLALDLLEQYRRHKLNEDLLKQDKHGCNVLHHAIRNNHEDLALQLIDQQPALSESRNNRQESPMFIAVLKGFKRVYTKLLSHEKSEYTGAFGYNALHAAVKYGEQGTRHRKLQHLTSYQLLETPTCSETDKC